MFKRNTIPILAILVMGFAMTLSAYQPAAAQTIKLTYSNFFPPAHVQSQLADAGAQEVNKRTNGRGADRLLRRPDPDQSPAEL